MATLAFSRRPIAGLYQLDDALRDQLAVAGQRADNIAPHAAPRPVDFI